MRNAAHWLPVLLAALVREWSTGFELIAIDDGSTDASAAVLRRLCAQWRFATWLEGHHDITAATPELRFPNGQRQFLCKRNPTLLALVSRRCIPRRLKPRRLRRYDNWYTMRDKPYSQVFASSYLSGCCLWMRGWAVQAVGGFDPRFFLYFEDADITRQLAAHGPTVNLPICTVTHHWGRGSYRNIWLTLVNLHSAWLYFRKWGLRWW